MADYTHIDMIVQLSCNLRPPAAGHVDAKYGCNVERPADRSRLVNGHVRPGAAVQ